MNRRLRADVYALRGLLEEQHRRFATQPLCDLKLLLVASAERSECPLDGACRPNVEALKPFTHLLALAPARDPPPVQQGTKLGQSHVLASRLLREGTQRDALAGNQSDTQCH